MKILNILLVSIILLFSVLTYANGPSSELQNKTEMKERDIFYIHPEDIPEINQRIKDSGERGGNIGKHVGEVSGAVAGAMAGAAAGGKVGATAGRVAGGKAGAAAGENIGKNVGEFIEKEKLEDELSIKPSPNRGKHIAIGEE